MTSIHPAVALAWFLGAVVCAMAFVQPATSAIAFAAASALGFAADGWRTSLGRLRWQLPMVAAITLLNGLFASRGATALLYIGPFEVRGESLAFGLCMGLALAAAVELFALLGETVPGDEALSLAAGRLPACSLLASMTLRLAPKTTRAGREYRDAARANTALRNAKEGGKAREASRMLSTLLGAALEDSLVAADSMRARGFGCGRPRTAYRRRRLALQDGAALAAVAAFALAVAVAVAASSSAFTFYPRIEGGASCAACALFAAYFLLPFAAIARQAGWKRKAARQSTARQNATWHSATCQNATQQRRAIQKGAAHE